MAYAAIASRCAPHADMAKVQGIFEEASNSESRLSGDGKRLSKLGVHALAVLLNEIAVDFDAEVVISDSAMCAVEGHTEDRSGKVIAKYISIATWPHWGASFSKGSFRRAVYQAWRRLRPKSRVMILITGNDVHYDKVDGLYIARLKHEMDSLKAYWAGIGLEIIYLEGISPCWQKC